MNPRHLLFALTLTACGSTVSGTERSDAATSERPANEADAPPDVATSPDGEAPRDGDAPADALGPCTTTVNGTLDAAPESTPYAPGPARVVTASADQVQGGCSNWYGGDDVALSFRAPRAGLWTFSGLGFDLWSLAVRADCATGGAELGCQRFTDYHGGAPFTLPLTATVRLAAGASVRVIGDGAHGASARMWTFSATLLAPRGCYDPDRACATGSRCLTPASGVEADSRCVENARPTLLSVEALSGRGLMRLFATVSDPDDTFASVRVRFFDASGALVAPASEVSLSAFGETRGAPFSAALAVPLSTLTRATEAEFVAVDSLRGTSDARRVAIAPVGLLEVGSACVPMNLRSVCVEGAGCTSASRCAAYEAPTMREARAFRIATPARTSLVFGWSDPNGDLLAADLQALDAMGMPLVAGPPLRVALRVVPSASAFEGTANAEMSGDAFAGAARLRVRLVDEQGLASAWRDVTVDPPDVVREGAACDPYGVTTACADPLRCTRAGSESSTCRAVAHDCPSGLVVPALTFDDGGVVAGAAGDLVDAPTLPPTIYGISPPRFVWRFTAPSAGAWTFTARTDRVEPGPSLEVRRLCTISDGGSLLGANSDYHGASTSTTGTLAAGEEVFLFAGSAGMRRIVVTAQRAM